MKEKKENDLLKETPQDFTGKVLDKFLEAGVEWL